MAKTQRLGSTMSDPLVSVIIPTFRRPELLTRALASVLEQTYEHWEILVVDDNDACSRARVETEALMRSYEGVPRLRYLKHQANKGLPAARNTGIAAASGSLIAFLDDDDAWLPEKLAKQVKVFRGADDVVLVYTGLHFVDNEGHLLKTSLPSPEGIEEDRLLEENWIGTPSSVMCRRSALVAAGAFDENMPSLEDWELYIRLRGRFAFVDEALTTYHLHDGGRMMEDLETRARALELLYQKNLDELIRKRRQHAAILGQFGYVMLASGKRGRARRYVLHSLYLHPFNRRMLRLLMRVELGEAGAARVGKLTGTVRGIVNRRRKTSETSS
jgi:glycosyltransferase involved in cell wall biosynthesis